jgi:multidrug efflux system membrane fusion protein
VVTASVLVFGHTEAANKADLKVRTAGIVERIVHEKGSRIKAGTPILVIKIEDRAARRDSAASALAKAEMEFTTSKQLYFDNLISRVEYMQAEAAFKQAAANLDQVNLDADNTTVRAPFDGIINALDVVEGSFVTANMVIGNFVDLGRIKIKAELPEKYISRIKVGSSARVVLSDGRSIDAKLAYAASVANSSTRTFPVELMSGNEERLVEGLTAEITLPLDKVMATKLSVSSCLTFGEDGSIGVKVVDADNRVGFHAVSLVREDADGLWVSGLPESAAVIVAGQEFVRVGETVVPVRASVGGE